MKYILLLFSLFYLNISTAQVSFVQKHDEFSSIEIESIQPPILNSFAEATEWADLVAIAQVDDIEYEQVRELNAKGYAFLNILIPYKGSKKDEPIAVVASGFESNACYYPDRINEGERFLVFLKKAPNDKSNVYYGYKPFCQFQILLSDLGQYILRTPLDTDAIKIDETLIQDTVFNDPHVMIDATLWTNIDRKSYAEKFHCKIIETEDSLQKYYHLRYTQGIPIYDVRPLLKLKYKARIRSDQM